MDYICNLAGKEVHDPVDLNLDGTPMDSTSYRVGWPPRQAVAAPVPVVEGPNLWPERVADPTRPGKWYWVLHFRKFRAQPCSGLL